MPAPPVPETPAASRLSRLSSLLDGDLEAEGADEACHRWRDDPDWRAAWHRYHLIGDVMRSGELANPPDRDARLLARIRERLASEAPIVAPAPLPPAGSPRRPRWIAPAAVAAGFVAVAGVLVVIQDDPPGGGPGATLVQGEGGDALRRASVTPLPATVAASMVAPATLPADATMIRDAQIERYFRAHREMRASPAAALPGGAPRPVDAIVMQR